MTAEDSCCVVCCRGFYSCTWKQSKNDRCACCWFSFVTLVSLLSLCWMYICLVTFNDQDEVNWQGFTLLNLWVNWFMVLIIISAVITSYSILLLLFALFQVALQEQLNLHWIHKIFLFLGVLFIAFGVVGFSLKWKQEWPTVLLSLQATGPFLQFGAVGALTLLSPFVFRSYFAARNKCSRFFIAVAFILVSAAIFLCPVYIQTQAPCLIKHGQLPKKPELIAHRGASMLAPENTMMSFKRSVECGVIAFETDVQLSKDRVPFLMHDHNPGFLRRTTDIKNKFPDKIFNQSSDFTWEELQSLNAGEWFIDTDPFSSVWNLSEDERQMARNQSIPSLLDLLYLAKDNNIQVLFDLYSPDTERDTEDVVDTILHSGIDPSLILWLPSKKREHVKWAAPGFVHVYNDSEKLRKNMGNYLNLKYSVGIEEIRRLRNASVTVNLWVVNERWLFSLLWCAGASSVTTNSCHLLKNMDEPDLVMSLRKYKIIWITVDISSILTMTGIYILCWKTQCLCLREVRQKRSENPSGRSERELRPFLAL